MGNKDFLKNSGILVGGSMLGQLIIFLSLPLLTRMYTPEQFGDATLFMQIVSVLVVIASFRLELAVVVEGNRNRAIALLQLTLLLSLVFSLFVGLFTWLGYDYWLRIFKLPANTTWFYLIPVAILINAWGEILVQWQTREKRFKTVSTGRLSGSVLGTATKFLYFWKDGAHSMGLILGQISLFAITLVLYFPLKLKTLFQSQFSNFKSLLKQYKSYPLWGTPAALVNTLGFALPVIILTIYFGNETVGYFGNAVKVIFTPLTVLSMSFSQVFFEHISRIKNKIDEANEYVMYTLKRVALIAFFPTLFVVFFGIPVFKWLFEAQWALSGYYAQITMMYFFIIYLTSPFAAAFTVYDKLKSQLLITLVFTILNNVSLWLAIYFTNDVAIGLLCFSLSGIIIRMLMMGYYFHLYGKQRNGWVLLIMLLAIGLTLVGYFLR